MMKALILLSGGIDSATALGLAVRRYGKEETAALAINYGQRHDKELKAAKAVATHYDVHLKIIDLTAIFLESDSSLLKGASREIPKGSYAAQMADSESKELSTYVPYRNGLFLSVAASVALGIGCESLWYGAHADEQAGAAYPDCSLDFHRAISASIDEGSGHSLTVEAPFIRKTKAEIVKIGIEIGVPYELTWSCYVGGDIPCGKCATCVDRASAFAANGVSDPAISCMKIKST